MKKLLFPLLLLAGLAHGQLDPQTYNPQPGGQGFVFTGQMQLKGAVELQASTANQSPFTYAARTDNCELGSEASGAYGCNGSATTGQQGAALSYLGRNYNLVSFTTDGSGVPTFITSANTFVNGQTVSFESAKESWLNTVGGTGTPLTISTILSSTSFKTNAIAGHNSYSSGAEPVPPYPQAIVTDTLPAFPGTALSHAGDGSPHCVTDPDFGARICALTDYTHFNSVGQSWNLGAAESRRFSSDSPPSFLLITNSFAGYDLLALTYSGSGPTTAVTSTLTALGHTDLPGSYAFSRINPIMIWEFLQGQYSPTTAVAIPPTTCSTGGCVYVNQINKITLGCTAGTIPLCSGGTLVVASRVKIFDFNCEGGGCPSSSTNYNSVGGFNIGTDSPNCLPANWNAGWNGTFWTSDDDTSVSSSLGDNGQGGLPGGSCPNSPGGVCLGAAKLVNWTVNKGARCMDTYAGTINGDYGPTGATINGQPNVITGIANQVLPDHFVMHEGSQVPNSSYVNFTPSHNCVAPAAVHLQSFTTDSGGVPTFVTDANSFYEGQTISFLHANESWLNNVYTFVIPVGGIIDNQHFTTSAIAGHPNYSSGAEPGGTNGASARSATSNNCQCGINGIANFCDVYFWAKDGLTVQPCGSGNQVSQCQGHAARGVNDYYAAKYYTAFSYADVTLPITDANNAACTPNGQCRLFPNAFPTDQHATYVNHGASDQPPVFLVSTNACNGPGDCDPRYTAADYDEVDAAENFVNNSNAKHCGAFPNGSPGTAPCNYRFAHTGNTGDDWNFNVQEAIGSISPDGQWLAFPTDWGHGFGCEDGTTLCLSSLQASSKPNETINSWSTDSGGILTVVTSATVQFVIGQRVTITGAGYPSWLTTPTWVLTGVSGTNFTAAGGTANQSGSTTGTAKTTSCNQDQTMPCQRGDLVIVALPTAHQ